MGVAIWGQIPRTRIGLDDLAGQTIAFDAFNTIYYFLTMIRHRTSGEPLKNHDGHITSHLSGLLYRTVKFMEASIKPVYVFNGRYPAFKKRTVEQRRAKRKQAQRKWKAAIRAGRPALKYAQEAARIDASIVDSAQTLLDLMGVPWIQAPSEGEAQCAWMCQRGLVYATASQDFDSLLFGSPRLVRNLSAITKKEPDVEEAYPGIDPELVELAEVLARLGVTREQLVLVAILIGTDYNEGIRGVGPVSALKLVEQQKTLEKILSTCQFPGATDVAKVYKFFLDPPHTACVEMAWNPPQAEQLFSFLVEAHDFSRERTAKALERLHTAHNVAGTPAA
jgi:flap endonuclease-1